MKHRKAEETLHVRVGDADLEGSLEIPSGAAGVVLFAHGSGSSRLSPRNQFVARSLREAGLGTFLVDLLSPQEETERDRRFDIEFLADRVRGLTGWLRAEEPTRPLRVGYFGASTGAAAALLAASEAGPDVGAVVSRGGRPDLVSDALPQVRAPVMFIVGSEDHPVLEWNADAFELLTAPKEFVVIPGATHLFEEPGALEEVARCAAGWFIRHLGAGGQ